MRPPRAHPPPPLPAGEEFVFDLGDRRSLGCLACQPEPTAALRLWLTALAPAAAVSTRSHNLSQLKAAHPEAHTPHAPHAPQVAPHTGGVLPPSATAPPNSALGGGVQAGGVQQQPVLGGMQPVAGACLGAGLPFEAAQAALHAQQAQHLKAQQAAALMQAQQAQAAAAQAQAAAQQAALSGRVAMAAPHVPLMTPMAPGMAGVAAGVAAPRVHPGHVAMAAHIMRPPQGGGQ